MKTLSAKAKISGLTLIELLVVICVIAVLAAILLPAFAPVKSGRQIQCLSNQHQIAIGLIIFEDDHAGKFPAQVSMTNGGSFEIVSNGSASAQFQTFSSYLGNRPNLLICLTDKARHAATNFSKLKNENVSYFLNSDALTNSASVLTGDRHLEIDGKPINSGIFLQITNMQMNWADGFHINHGKPWGGFSFADGHAQFIRAEELNSTLQRQPLATNLFSFP
jgi:prepilin-type N-terminal cleavage/methylation domain-containing protein